MRKKNKNNISIKYGWIIIICKSYNWFLKIVLILSTSILIVITVDRVQIDVSTASTGNINGPMISRFCIYR